MSCKVLSEEDTHSNASILMCFDMSGGVRHGNRDLYVPLLLAQKLGNDRFVLLVYFMEGNLRGR